MSHVHLTMALWRARGQTFAVGLAVALLAALLTFGRAQAQGPSLTVEATPVTITAGETARFTVTLQAGANPINNAVLSMTVDGPVHRLQFLPVPGQSSGVTTDLFNRRGQTLRWRGDLAANGKLVLLAIADSDPTPAPGDTTITLRAIAGPQNNPDALSDEAAVTVNTPPPLNPGDVAWAKSFTDSQGNALTARPDGTLDLPAGAAVSVRLVISNNSTSPLVGVIQDSYRFTPTLLSQVGAGFCQVKVVSSEVVVGRAFPISRDFDASSPYLAFYAVLPPGEALVIEAEVLPVSVFGFGGGVDGVDCSVANETSAYLRALPDGTLPADVPPTRQQLARLVAAPPTLRQLLILYILASDFGDAPDSTNHFAGVNMTAYLAPAPVNGRFPTVFDPALGAPQGPKHKAPRLMFLGSRVDVELSPDLFFGRNLNPPADLADLDAHDDGVNPALPTWQHCLATLIPFDATFTQPALDWLAAESKTVYLNIWLDGNRDGDWDDVLNCDGIAAPEHIVIDQALAPAAPGLISLLAPTGNLPIPVGNETRDMWLRVTLSEEPSVKTAQVLSLGQVVEYGDGRGPSTGFVLGETEDYLVNPAGGGSGRGSDLSLDLDFNVVRVPITLTQIGGAAVEASAVISPLTNHQDRAVLRARMRNIGAIANSGKLVIETTPYLGLPDVTVDSWYGCITCTVTAAAPAALTPPPAVREVCDNDGCVIELDFLGLPPARAAALLLSWSWGAEKGREVEIQARVEGSSPDANPANNTVQLTGVRPRLPLAFLYPAPGQFTKPITLSVASAATPLAVEKLGNFEIQLILQAEPGLSVQLFAEAMQDVFVTEVVAGSNGRVAFTVPITPGLGTDAGNLRLRARYAPAPTAAAVTELDKSSPYLALQYVPDLPFNPAGLGATYAPSNRPLPLVDASGHSAAEGWILPYVEQDPLLFSAELTCIGPVSASLELEEQSYPLAQVDSSAIYTTSFNLPEVNDEALVSFIVNCNGVESTYNGRLAEILPSRVENAVTGEPIAGARVLLWTQAVDQDSVQFIRWPGELFGQANPQITDAAGQFVFIPNLAARPTVLGLTVEAPGYHPLRIGPLLAPGAQIPPRRTVYLLPLGSDADTELGLTPDGFTRRHLALRAGTTLRLVNAGPDFASFQEPDAILRTAGASFLDSGLIAPGQTVDVAFDTPGTYTVVNGENPDQQVTIVVFDATNTLYLPNLTR